MHNTFICRVLFAFYGRIPEKERSLTAGIFRRNGGDELRRDIDGWGTGDDWWYNAARRDSLRHQWRERRAGSDSTPQVVNQVNAVNQVTSCGRLSYSRPAWILAKKRQISNFLFPQGCRSATQGS